MLGEAGLKGGEAQGFTFDRAFNLETKQEEVFEYGVRGIVDGKLSNGWIGWGGLSRAGGGWVVGEAARARTVMLINSGGMIGIADVMDGYNGTVFAYGQTGSGKSHTMMVSITTLQAPVARGVAELAPSARPHLLHRHSSRSRSSTR